MSAAARDRVERLFLEMLEVPEDRRVAVLRERCAGDEAVRAEVAALLGHHEKAGAFLDSQDLRRTRAVGGGAEGWRSVRAEGYAILGVLGSGGMGLVYLAEQQRPRRKVALKVMRRAPSRSLQQRFLREAELAGGLQHPGIAQVYESGLAEELAEGGAAGSGETVPFIAMELVEGKPLGEYAEGAGLGVRERVGLVVRVCGAMEHAHQRGVIHRDLKPGNILVTASGEPKVLDFGVARATNREDEAGLERTMAGQLLGTLPYMSPEQVGARPEEVDTRADVYALGVILYELLAGRRPITLHDCGIEEALRRIREVEPTPLGDAAPALRGDLAAITARALEKAASRRYPSVAELRADLERYLLGEPVLARGDRTLYLMGKRLRRYWKYYALAGAAFMALGVFGVVSYRQSLAEALAKEEALAALATAKASRDAADAARALADGANLKLNEQLRTSLIERGRLLGLAGERREGERLLWNEHLKRPTSERSFWALTELYSRHPCRYWSDAGGSIVARMVVSDDGRLVVAAQRDGAVRLIRVSDGVVERTLRAGDRAAVSVAVRGDRIAAGMLDGTVAVWDRMGERLVGRRRVHAAVVNSVVFTPEGEVLSGSSDGTVCLWRDGWAYERGVYKAEPSAGVDVVRVMPDGQRLLIGTSAGHVRLTDWSGEVLSDTPSHTARVMTADISPDGATIITGSNAQSVAVNDGVTGALVGRRGVGHGPIRRVAYLPGGREFLAVGWSRVEVWDLEKIAPTGRVIGAAQGWADGVLTPRGRELVLAPEDAPGVSLWELEPTQPRVDAELPTVSDVWAVGDASGAAGTGRTAASTRGGVIFFGGGGTRVMTEVPETRNMGAARGAPVAVVATFRGRVAVLDAATGAVTRRVRPPSRDVAWVKVSDDGRTFAGVGSRTLTIGDTRTGMVREWPTGAGSVLMMAMDPGGRFAAVVYQNPAALDVYDLRDGTVRRAALGGPPLGIAVSDDGTRVAAALWNQTAEVFDAASMEKVLTLSGHGDLVMGVAFLREDSLIATSARDGVVRLWDSTSGEVVAILPSARSNIRFMRPLSPTRLAGMGWDGIVRYWDLDHYARHVLGSAPRQIERFEREGGVMDRTAVEAWLEGLRAAGPRP